MGGWVERVRGDGRDGDRQYTGIHTLLEKN